MKYAARLATALDAQVVMPDYPLAPEHTWRDSHEDVVRVIQRAAETSDRVVVVGDSAGGGIALAAALTVRDRGGPQPSHLLLHAPWVDLTTSTPETAVVTLEDPWLFIGKMYAYASWWAGSEEDLGRPEVSPALADLSGLPRALMFSGTRDTLMPGCRLLARRAAEAGWDLTYVEQPGLLHVYPILPFIPEAKQAWRTTRGVPAVRTRDHLRVAVRRPRPLTAYSLWKLRQDVFVVEQDCLFQDLDGLDLLPDTRHVVLEDEHGVVLGCARVARRRATPGGSAGSRCTRPCAARAGATG